MIFVYVVSVLAIVQGVLTLIDGIRAAKYMRERVGISKGEREGTPVLEKEGWPIQDAAEGAAPRRYDYCRITVFCPCKGIDHGFDENIRSILDQDHPNFSVQFIVDSADDPAYQELRNLGALNILIAGKASDCGQKVHNILEATRNGENAAEIYAFCDSDARYPRHWLRSLTAPLSNPDVAVTTGYRWYMAQDGSLPTLLRSAWNASIVGMLGDHSRNFAWGGSMALRRETFDRLSIREAWQGALSDDYAVTRAAQHAHAQIAFVPACLIPTHGTCSWSELFEFTTRQIIITRIYHPQLWRLGFLAQSIFALSFIGSITVPALWTAIYVLAGAKSWIRISAVRTVIGPAALSKHTWFYILSAPVVALLFEYNMLRSALSTKIVWRQIHYKLISPNRTLVLPRDGSAADGS
jgi:ceramide glucosyltransferase